LPRQARDITPGRPVYEFNTVLIWRFAQPNTFDLITNHDCIHDLVDPVGVLKTIRFEKRIIFCAILYQK
jgi:hypothetical protein